MSRARRHTDGAAVPALTPSELLLVDAIAQRVMEIMEIQCSERVASGATDLLDAASVAATLGVSRDYVYAHWQELGGKRLGSGPRGRLRFDLDRALAAWTPCSTRKESREPKRLDATGVSTRRHRERMGSSRDLLPIRGSAVATEADLERL
jgi:hypothetical protein